MADQLRRIGEHLLHHLATRHPARQEQPAQPGEAIDRKSVGHENLRRFHGGVEFGILASQGNVLDIGRDEQPHTIFRQTPCHQHVFGGLLGIEIAKADSQNRFAQPPLWPLIGGFWRRFRQC